MLKAIAKIIGKAVGAVGALAAYLAGRKAEKHAVEKQKREHYEAEMAKWRNRPRDTSELLVRLHKLRDNAE